MSIIKGKIKPALATWPMGLCHPEKWSLEKICQVAKQLGMEAVEVVSPEDFPTLKSHGLTCALTTSHWFIKGPNNKAHWPECETALLKSIDAAAKKFDEVGVRTRAIQKRLRDVQDLPAPDSAVPLAGLQVDALPGVDPEDDLP